MAESQIFEPPAVEATQPQASTAVCDSWQQTVQAVLGGVLLLGAMAMVHYYSPTAELAQRPNEASLQNQVHELTAEVERLQQDQAMPATVLNRYRNSIGYIYGVYQVGFANQRPVVRARVSGTGFLVGTGLDRHQPSRRRALVWRLRSPEAHRSGRYRHAGESGHLFPRLAYARYLNFRIRFQKFRSGNSAHRISSTPFAAFPFFLWPNHPERPGSS